MPTKSHRPAALLKIVTIALALVAPVPAAGAVSCVLLPRGAATVERAGNPLELPVRLEDCSAVDVSTGTISACFVTDKGQRTCVAFTAGQRIAEEALAPSVNRMQGIGDAIVALLRGDVQTRAGQVRNGVANPLGLPFGALLGLDATMEIPIGTGLPIARFTVTDQASPVRVVLEVAPTTSIELPLRTLVPNAAYTWRAVAGGKSFTGRFLVAGAESDGLRRELRDIRSNPTLSEPEKAFLLADLLDAQGFLFERNLQVEALQRALAGKR